MKILIFGIPGSGKTTFSNRVSILTGIPIFHIDKHLFEEGKGWRKRPPEDFLADVKRELEKDSWIIEGCGMRSLEMRYKEADIAVFCSLPLSVCFFRIFSRASKGLFLRKKRPDCPDGAGNLVSMRLLKYMWNFEKIYGSVVDELNRRYPEVEHMKAGSNADLMEIYDRLAKK